MSADVIQDWPATLRMNAACVELAEATYNAYRTAYALSLPLFCNLSPHLKDGWIQIAKRHLEEQKPDRKGPAPLRVVTGLRPTHGSLIGTIGPESEGL